MSAYKQLKGIAAGLAGTFISRNNDVDGYWGMGVIYSEVSARGVSAVTFSLLDGAVSPSLKCGSLRRPETSGHRIPLFSCVVGYGSG